MHRVLSCSVLLLAVVLPVYSFAAAEDEPVTQRVSLSDDEVKRLVQRLDDEKYAVRDAASKRLASGDAAVATALGKAVKADKLELSYRIIEILDTMRRGQHEATRDAAKKAMEILGKHKDKAIARRTLTALATDEPLSEEASFDHIQLFGGLRRIEFGQGGGISIGGDSVRIGKGSQIVQSQMADGEQLVVVHQGGGRKIMIRASDKGIGVVVQELTEDGTVEENRYEAADEEELAEKHPVGHSYFDAYKKYKGGTVMGGMPAE